MQIEIKNFLIYTNMGRLAMMQIITLIINIFTQVSIDKLQQKKTYSQKIKIKIMIKIQMQILQIQIPR